MNFCTWLEEALAQDTWPLKTDYTRSVDGDTFDPPRFPFTLLSLTTEKRARVSVSR